VHAATSALTAAAIATCALLPEVDKSMIVSVSIGCLSGVLLSPDLDVDSGYIGISLAKLFFGSIFKWIWKWIWKPYAILVPHRSHLSHVPVLGTSLRLLYLYAVYLVIGSALMFSIGWPRTVYLLPIGKAILALLHGDAQIEVELIAASFVGLCVSDTMHAIMDAVSTTLKKLTFRRRNTWQNTLSDVGNARR
jgi:uncharacterized metal-binding protein